MVTKKKPEWTSFAFKKNLKDIIPERNFLTHNLIAYPAKFIPHVPYYVIKNYMKESNGIILDPFAGSGTTAVEAIRLGHNCICIDINPYTDFVTRIKSQEINYKVTWFKDTSLDIYFTDNSEKINELGNTNLKDISLNKILDNMKSYNGNKFYPKWNNIDYWYPEEFRDLLYNIWGFIYSLEKIYPKDFMDLMKLTGLYLSRYLSYGARDIPKLYKSKSRIKAVEALREKISKTPHLPFDIFKNKLVNNYNQILEYQKAIKNANIKPIYSNELSSEILEQKNKDRMIVCLAPVDSLEYKFNIKDEFIDLIVTSPPYVYAQEYIRSTKLDMYWLDLVDDKEVRNISRKELGYKKEFQSKKIKEALKEIPTFQQTYTELLEIEKVRYNKEKYTSRVFNYFYDMYRIIKKLTDKLKINGIFGFFVGNPTVLGKQILCSEIFYEIFELLGYEILDYGFDEIVTRQLLLSRNNESPQGMECEWLIIAKKTENSV